MEDRNPGATAAGFHTLRRLKVHFTFEPLHGDLLRGLALGQSALGFMFENGRGVDKNIKEAVKWYQLAAQQDNEYAKSRLAILEAK